MKKIFSSVPFLAILSCILWASSFVPTKTGLEYMTAPLQFAGYTFVLAGGFLAFFTKFRANYFSQVRANFPLVLKIAVFSTVILYGSYYMGQSMIDGSLASVIVSSQPFFVAVMAHFMTKNDRFSPLKAFSIAMAMVGIVVVSFPSLINMDTLGATAILGILLIIVDCVSAAYGNILISKVDFTKIDIRILNSSELALGGIILLALGYAFEGVHPLPIEPLFYVSLGAMVFITVCTAVMWFNLLARADAKVSELNMWKFLIPVFGSIESWLLLKGDTPNVYTISGMLILTGSLMIFYNKPLINFFFKSKTKQ